MAQAARRVEPADIISDFIARGYHVFEAGVDPWAAGELLAAIRKTRAFDASLFLTEAEFDADPRHVGVNPAPGRNLLEQLDSSFVETDAGVIAGLTDLLGDGYLLVDKKLVCGVPDRAVPHWLRARITDNPVNNLGAYVRPQHRDVTYFYGIDFHQDLIDFKGRDADFITVYVYLHPVGRHDAPLYLLEGSHRLGATTFPHDLARSGAGWLYRDGRGGSVEARQRVLIGRSGFAACWHACTLHGTQPDAADNERLSLRYLFARAPGAPCGLDAVNASLQGPIRLEATRHDLDAKGAARMKRNTVNRA